MTTLRVLGTTEVHGAPRHAGSLLTAPKRLALLAYLLLARPRGFHRRDTLLALLWPDLGQQAARNALSNLLFHIRQVLGPDVLENRGRDEIRVRADRIDVDAIRFEQLLDAGSAGPALALYRGSLLEGFYVPAASAEFEQWLDGERERLALRAAGGWWVLAEQAEASGDAQAARDWAARAAGVTPYSEESCRRLIVLYTRLGDPARALRAYDEFAARLRQAWEIEPSAAIRAEVEAIRKQRIQIAVAPVRERPAGTATAASVAVLPFESVGSGGGFAEGIHSDLLTRLSELSGLSVISRTSVRRYRGADKQLSEIGAKLGVQWIVEGEVHHASDEVRVTVRLVDAQTDRQVWVRAFRRRFTAEDVFGMQSEITRDVARSLEARLTPEEERRIDARPTRNMDAYRLYVRGRRLMDNRDEEMRRALDVFAEAAELDPAYAPAWAGVADACALLHDYGYADADMLDQAEEALGRALSIDAELAEAHATRGLIHTIRHEGRSAVDALMRAVDLRPGYTEAHNWLSWLSSLLGHRSEACERARRAVALDPLSPESVSNLSLALLINGRPAEALVEAQRVREMGSAVGLVYEAEALSRLERNAEAAALTAGQTVPWAGPGVEVAHAVARLSLGDRTPAEELLAERDRAGDHFAAALLSAATGNPDDAFAHFERVETFGHWPTLAVRHFYPDVWASISSDPRLPALRQAVNRDWGMGPGVARDGGSTRKQSPLAIAVLPFDDLGTSEGAASFAAGLHTDLLTRLSRVRRLTVISRTSVAHYRRRNAPIAEVARSLGVGTVVEGSVQQEGDRLRVSVQFIDARRDVLRWAETFDVALSAHGLFQMQSELADRIVGSLRAELTPEERQGVDRRPTENLDAYRLYAQGRAHLDLRTEEALRRAEGCFRDAICQDDGYALAWAGLADAASLLAFYGFLTQDDVSNPVALATKSVELAPDMSETHAALGTAYAVLRRGPEALKALEHAARLNTNSADAFTWSAWIRLCGGNAEAALEPAERAVRLNPLAPALRAYLAEILLANGRTDRALDEARRAREIQPDYGLTHFVEGLVLHHDGRFEDVEPALDRARVLVPPGGTPTHEEIHTLLVLNDLAAGDLASAVARSTRARGSSGPISSGLITAALGRTDEALPTLLGVRDWHSFENEFVRYFFPDLLGSFRSDPRFATLLRQIDASWGWLS